MDDIKLNCKPSELIASKADQLAPLVGYWACNPEVMGSNPASTINSIAISIVMYH